jgi:ACDE family multidrug resistance protein
MLKNRAFILFFIFSITLLSAIGTVSLPPVLPSIAKVFNIKLENIGLVMFIYTLPGILLTPLFGYFIDKYGRKVFLIPSLIFYAIFSFACFTAQSFEMLLVYRFLQGIAVASLGSINILLISDFFNSKEKNKMLGINSAVLSLGTAIFPLISASLVKFGWNFPFLISTFALPVALWGIFSYKEVKNTDLENFVIKSTKNNVMRNYVYFFSIISYIVLFGCFITYLPFVIKMKLQGMPQHIGLSITFLSVGTIIIASMFDYLTKKINQMNLLAYSFLIQAIALVILIVAPSILIIFIASFLYGCGNALNFPNTQSLIVKLSDENQLATNLSFNRMSVLIGQTIGPLLMGFIIKFSNLETVFCIGISISILTFLFIYFIFIQKYKSFFN